MNGGNLRAQHRSLVFRHVLGQGTTEHVVGDLQHLAAAAVLERDTNRVSLLKTDLFLAVKKP
jgi:hypothetical protein